MDENIPLTGHIDAGWLEIFALLGAILLVVIGLFFWAAFLRNTKKKRKRKYREHRGNYREKLGEGAGEIKEYIEKNRHHRRRGHRHPNPTLADTGGLPPRRPEDGEAPSS
jgi:hypothetical protein